MRDISGIGSRGASRIAIVAGMALFFLMAALPAWAWSPAVVSIAASNSTSMALLDDGTVWQWGYVYGSGDWRAPQKINIAGVYRIAAGDSHVMALKSDGTVWAWGSNRYGELGDGTHNDSLAPVEVKGLTGVVAIASGKSHSLALKGDGTVWAWGSNAYGQIGQGSQNYAGTAIPVQVSGLNDITAIASGGSHNLALRTDGTVWAWGENIHGILGDGTNISRFAPAASKVRDLQAMDAGDYGHALAIGSDGNVWSWGFNYMGQLGKGGVSLNDQRAPSYGPESDCYNPDVVKGLPAAKAVAAGGSHSIAMGSDGTVWAWGSNSDGQLGQGSAGGNDVSSPMQVPGIGGVTAVAAGMYHTLALKGDGSVWAWGSNADGQVGNGSVSSTASPVLVLMGSQIPPKATPGPVIATTEPTTATPPESGTNFLLIGAAGLIVVILAVAVAAYLLAFRKKGKKDDGKKGL